MARDPYEEPSDEELEAAGANDWFSDSLARQAQRDARLKAGLNPDTRSVKKGKEQLRSLLELPPDLNPEEPAPDLFASEREAARRGNSSLSSLMGDLEDSRTADQDLLRDMFGAAPSKGQAGKGPRKRR